MIRAALCGQGGAGHPPDVRGVRCRSSRGAPRGLIGAVNGLARPRHAAKKKKNHLRSFHALKRGFVVIRNSQEAVGFEQLSRVN